jgi:hypothetical protein
MMRGKCPHCGFEEGILRPCGAPAQAGDLALCMRCLGTSVVVHDRRLHPPTPAQLEAIRAQPVWQSHSARAYELLRRKVIRSRGRPGGPADGVRSGLFI